MNRGSRAVFLLFAAFLETWWAVGTSVVAGAVPLAKAHKRISTISTLPSRSFGSMVSRTLRIPLLHQWRPHNYARDRMFGFVYHLNQDTPMTTVGPGDTLWAFTLCNRDGLYHWTLN